MAGEGFAFSADIFLFTPCGDLLSFAAWLPHTFFSVFFAVFAVIFSFVFAVVSFQLQHVSLILFSLRSLCSLRLSFLCALCGSLLFVAHGSIIILSLCPPCLCGYLFFCLCGNLHSLVARFPNILSLCPLCSLWLSFRLPVEFRTVHKRVRNFPAPSTKVNRHRKRFD